MNKDDEIIVWRTDPEGRHFPIKKSNNDESSKSYKDGVNERVKWAKENGVDLPLNTDGSLDDLKLQEIYNSGTVPLPDEQLPRSLGARWINFEIVGPDGKIYKFAEGSKLQEKVVFAGKGCRRKIDEVDRLVNEYNVKAEEWRKVKAKAVLVGEDGEERFAEVHWYECESRGKEEMKFKKWID